MRALLHWKVCNSFLCIWITGSPPNLLCRLLQNDPRIRRNYCRSLWGEEMDSYRFKLEVLILTSMRRLWLTLPSLQRNYLGFRQLGLLSSFESSRMIYAVSAGNHFEKMISAKLHHAAHICSIQTAWMSGWYTGQPVLCAWIIYERRFQISVN